MLTDVANVSNTLYLYDTLALLLAYPLELDFKYSLNIAFIVLNKQENCNSAVYSSHVSFSLCLAVGWQEEPIYLAARVAWPSRVTATPKFCSK